MSNAVDWDYFDKFQNSFDKYLPKYGQGDTVATQVCTAVTKLIYKYYNDGDVYDNSYLLVGWCNNLSSYANWLNKYAEAGNILCKISECQSEDDYTILLKELADRYLDIDYLDSISGVSAQGDIYNCDGPFEFNERYDDWEEES